MTPLKVLVITKSHQTCSRKSGEWTMETRKKNGRDPGWSKRAQGKTLNGKSHGVERGSGGASKGRREIANIEKIKKKGRP